MNTYSTYGPWPENPDSDYLLADLIEALALERLNLERVSLNRPAKARRKPALFRDCCALNGDTLSVVLQ